MSEHPHEFQYEGIQCCPFQTECLECKYQWHVVLASKLVYCKSYLNFLKENIISVADSNLSKGKHLTDLAKTSFKVLLALCVLFLPSCPDKFGIGQTDISVLSLSILGLREIVCGLCGGLKGSFLILYSVRLSICSVKHQSLLIACGG